MRLLEFQTALGRSVRADGRQSNESHGIDRIRATAGYRVTVDIQRSWCRGRAAKAARLTLSVLPASQRAALLDDWVRAGGGTASFHWDESEAFLEFIAGRLPNPSHFLSICRMEQAAVRASTGALYLEPREPAGSASECLVGRGQYASLVPFYGDPARIVGAVDGLPLPPLSPECVALLFAPGLAGLVRPATCQEIAVWDAVAQPRNVRSLERDGHRQEIIDALLECSAIEPIA